jgi:hypothetical protein
MEYTPCTLTHATPEEARQCIRQRHRERLAAANAIPGYWTQHLTDRAAAAIVDEYDSPEATANILTPDEQERIVETLAEVPEFRATMRAWLEVAP